MPRLYQPIAPAAAANTTSTNSTKPMVRQVARRRRTVGSSPGFSSVFDSPLPCGLDLPGGVVASPARSPAAPPGSSMTTAVVMPATSGRRGRERIVSMPAAAARSARPSSSTMSTTTHGDVVAAAALVGLADQLRGGVAGLGEPPEGGADLLGAHLVEQAVGADDVAVAGARHDDELVDLDGRRRCPARG